MGLRQKLVHAKTHKFKCKQTMVITENNIRSSKSIASDTVLSLAVI